MLHIFNFFLYLPEAYISIFTFVLGIMETFLVSTAKKKAYQFGVRYGSFNWSKWSTIRVGYERYADFCSLQPPIIPSKNLWDKSEQVTKTFPKGLISRPRLVNKACLMIHHHHHQQPLVTQTQLSLFWISFGRGLCHFLRFQSFCRIVYYAVSCIA